VKPARPAPGRTTGRAARWRGALALAASGLLGSVCHAAPLAVVDASGLRSPWIAGAAGALGVLALLLAGRARRSGYGWFGAASLLWALREATLPGGPAADAKPLTAVLHQAGFAWIAVLGALYAMNVVGRDTTRTRLVLGGWAAAALALAAGAVLLPAPLLGGLLRAGTLAMAMGVLWVLATAARQQPGTPAVLLTVTAVIGLAIGLRDLWVFGQPEVGDAVVAWSRYTVLLLIAVAAWLLVDEFTRSSAELRALNRDLLDRVAQKERDLQMAFEGTRLRDQQQAVLAERDRILREMHDGLGGRLVAAMALTSQVERQSLPPPGGEPRSVDEPLRDLKLTLDDCLVELRLALDSLETDQRPLIEALAELRFRVEPSLRAAGVRLVWQLDDAASEVELPAAETLHVLRIVREALTNVIKHAHATVVWLRLEARGTQRLALAVVDNGLQQRMSEAQVDMPLFVPPSIVHGGRGLANMQRRATALSARLDSGPHPEGWAVTLELPLPGAAAG
jgi:hypothetical protein